MTPQSGVGIVGERSEDAPGRLALPRVYDFVMRTGCAMNSLTRSTWWTSFDGNADGSLARTSVPDRSTTYARTPLLAFLLELRLMGASESSASTTPIGSWPSAGRTGTARTSAAVGKDAREERLADVRLAAHRGVVRLAERALDVQVERARLGDRSDAVTVEGPQDEEARSASAYSRRSSFFDR